MTAAVSLAHVPLEELHESPLNHRRTWGDMEELTKSIRTQGVLQPVVARPVAQGYELIFGHRRFRAAKAAGLKTIPVLVRAASDIDVIEAQVIENLQRADVHPLEEAEGYEQLLKQTERPLSVEDLAAKVGKSKAYVYGRLKLLALLPAARKAFYAGKMTPSVALLVARVPEQLQVKALALVTPPWAEGKPMDYARAAEHVRREFMLDLKGAGFDPADAGLVTHAGPCTTCSKRTGANPDLFGDVSDADVCTDPPCFRKKLDAMWDREKEAALDAGRPVLTAKEAKDIFDEGHFSASVRYSSGYTTKDQYHQADPKGRTLGKLLGKHAAAAVVLAQAPNGQTVELLPKKAIPKLLKAAGHDFKTERQAVADGAAGYSAKDREAQRRANEDHRLKLEVQERAAGLVAETLYRQPITREFWELVSDLLLQDGELLDTIERRKLGDVAAFRKKRKEMSDAELMATCLDGVIYARLRDGYGENKINARFSEWACVDVKTLRKTIEAERATAAEKPAKPAKKGKGADRG